MARSSAVVSAGSEKLTEGSSRTTAPIFSSRSFKPRACSMARVTTMRFPSERLRRVHARVPRVSRTSSAAAPRSRNLRATRAPIASASAGAPESFSQMRCAPSGDKHGDIESQCSILDASPCSNRNLAATFEAGQRRALGGDSAARLRSHLTRPERCIGFGVVRARLDSDRSLPRRGQARRRAAALGNVAAQAQAVESRPWQARWRRNPRASAFRFAYPRSREVRAFANHFERKAAAIAGASCSCRCAHLWAASPATLRSRKAMRRAHPPACKSRRWSSRAGISVGKSFMLCTAKSTR